MKHAIAKRLALAALLAAFAAAAPDAAPKPPQFAADAGNGAVYVVKRGKKTRLSAELHSAEAGGAVKFRYALIDAQAHPAAGANGVAFFAPNGKAATFAALPGNASDAAVSLSPDGAKFVLSFASGENTRTNRVYATAGMRPLCSAAGSALDWSGPVWVDSRRFAFTAYDEAKMKKPGVTEGGAGYTSVALFDTVSRRVRPLLEATPTDEYALLGARDGFVLAGHYAVDKPEEWAAGAEENEHLSAECVYAWVPGWKPGEWWQTPERTFVVQPDPGRVVALDAGGRHETGIALRKGTFRDSVSEDGEQRDFWWFVDENPGGVSLIYVFTGGEDEQLAAVFPTDQPRRLREVSISPAGERLIAAMGDEGSLRRELEVYRLTLRVHEPFAHLMTLRPAFGQFFWADPWRVVYSALNLEADLKSGREPGYALDVYVYDSAVDEIAKLTESSTADSWQAVGLTDDGHVAADQITVPEFADWKDPAKERRTRIKVRMPAAG